MIDIRGLSKADVLIALYNHAKPRGMGYLHYTPTDMTPEQATELLDALPDSYFDYVGGRVLKVDLSGTSFNEALYDRDNGTGAAERALAPLRRAAAAPVTGD